jgi:hypothetical protein
MSLEPEQYDPMRMGTEKRRELFNEVAQAIVQKEGRAYMDIVVSLTEKDGRAANESDYQEMGSYAVSIATNFSLGLSMALMNAFNQKAAPVDQVREEYRRVDELYGKHYEAQRKKGDALFVDDKILNAEIDLFMGVHRTLLDCLEQRLG